MWGVCENTSPDAKSCAPLGGETWVPDSFVGRTVVTKVSLATCVLVSPEFFSWGGGGGDTQRSACPLLLRSQRQTQV